VILLERVISVVLVFVVIALVVVSVSFMFFRLGTSVLIFRHPALPSGSELSAAASELSVWIWWRDELPERWT
jgi:hypothetical protein